MSQPFSFEFPYASQRMPVMARNVVATSQPLASQAGLAMLAQGGNAVDAALAAAITLTVVEPTSNGIGSDAFAILWDGAGLRGYNASGRSPAGWSAEYFDSKYPGLALLPERGWDSVTVPGCVSLWQTLSRAHGRLPFARLFEAAIRYAEEGHPVSPITAVSWARQVSLIQGPAFAEFHRVFAPAGRAPAAGEMWRSPDHGRTLRDIADSEGRSFYEGRLAEAMEAESRRCGAQLRQEDLAAHRCDETGTLHIDYRRVRLHEIPPNGQGIAALICLGILENFDLGAMRVDSVEWVHLHIEAMKLAFADVYAHVADPDGMLLDPARLLDKHYLRQRAGLIRPDRAGAPVPGIPLHGGTVYLTAADDQGLMVSLIQSNYMGFGSGIVVPGCGIALQNRGHGFVRAPGHPNAVAPRKRPFQTIIPGFLTDHEDRPLMSFGVMGGHMQPQGHVQMVTRMIDQGQNPQSASDAPRWIVNADGTIGLEPALRDSVGAALEERGHRLAQAEAVNFAFGGAQLIWKLAEGAYCAGSDSRKDGGAVGF